MYGDSQRILMYNLHMKNFLYSLLDLIYRKRCYFCRSSKYSVKMCPKCYDELCFSDFGVNRIINGANIFSCGVYEKNLQKLIRGLKYHRQKDLAFYLAKFMSEYFSKLGIEKVDYVVPVPLHKNRIKKRKYNHMELVTEEFCKLTGFEPKYDLIKRVKDTKPQYSLSRAQRMENLFNAFEVCDKEDLSEKTILILDDICTTGSTFEEMITSLKKAGAKNIICLAASSP